MKEYFDVVDQNRKPTNKRLLRGSKLGENEFNTGVEMWLFNDKNELLLTQRSLEKSHPLQWECPGGCVVAGETSNQTVVRELKEEVGIDLNDNFELLATHLYKYQFVDIYYINMNVELSELHLQKEEVSGAKFVTLEEFEEMNKNNQIVPSVAQRYEIIKDKLEERRKCFENNKS